MELIVGTQIPVLLGFTKQVKTSNSRNSLLVDCYMKNLLGIFFFTLFHYLNFAQIQKSYKICKDQKNPKTHTTTQVEIAGKPSQHSSFVVSNFPFPKADSEACHILSEGSGVQPCVFKYFPC